MNDNDKLFEFMSKMYLEMQEGFKEVKIQLNKHTEQFVKLENEVKKIDAKIEGELIPRSIAAIDGYKDNAEHIAIIEDKIDKLQIEVNNISMKTTYNDSRIIELSNDLKKAR